MIPKRKNRGPYKAEPEKNKAFTPEQAAAAKRRIRDRRRVIEDERIDKELGVK